MRTDEILKTDKKLHDFLEEHLLRGRVEKIMEAYLKAKVEAISDEEIDSVKWTSDILQEGFVEGVYWAKNKLLNK